MELLSSDLPVKVLVETEVLLDPGHFGFGMRSTQLASTAVGLVDVFALQTTSSNLYQLRERLLAGLQYAGRRSSASSRARRRRRATCRPTSRRRRRSRGAPFPRSRTTLRPGRTWRRASRSTRIRSPSSTGRSRSSSTLTRRSSASWSRSRSRSSTSRSATGATRATSRASRASTGTTTRSPSTSGCRSTRPKPSARVPHVLVVDENDSLQRLIVDAKLMQAARRCRELWHGLQELGLAQPARRAAPVGEAQTEAVEESAAEPPQEAEKRRRPSRRETRSWRSACRTSRGSRPRAARRATSAPQSTTGCSPTTRTSRHTSRTPTLARSASSSRRRRLPGGDHPPRQAAQPERAGPRRADRAGEGVPVGALGVVARRRLEVTGEILREAGRAEKHLRKDLVNRFGHQRPWRQARSRSGSVGAAPPHWAQRRSLSSPEARSTHRKDMRAWTPIANSRIAIA